MSLALTRASEALEGPPAVLEDPEALEALGFEHLRNAGSISPLLLRRPEDLWGFFWRSVLLRQPPEEVQLEAPQALQQGSTEAQTPLQPLNT